MTLTLRKLTGETVAVAVWFIPGTGATVTTKLIKAQYDAWHVMGRVGVCPGQPDPTAVHLISGYKKALDTADGFPNIGDCWIDDIEDPVTGETIQGLHVATGDDPAGHWGYHAGHVPGVGKQVTARCNHRHYATEYDTAHPEQTAISLTAPHHAVQVAAPVVGGVGHSWGTTPVNQAVGSWSSGSSYTVTVTAPTAGNFVGAATAVGGGTFVVSSISQTNVSWPGAADITKFVSRDVELWSVASAGASAGVTVTVTLSGTPPNGATIVYEFNYGTDTASLDQTATNNGSSTTVSQAITPAAGVNMLTIVAVKASQYEATPGGGFTAFTDNGLSSGVEAAYRVDASAAGPYTCTWPTSAVWVTAAASYKSVAAGGSAVDDEYGAGAFSPPTLWPDTSVVSVFL